MNTPAPWVRDGEFDVWANPGGPAGHFAIVEMGDGPAAWNVGLTLHDVGDCDRIIRAVSTARRMLEAISAGTPHEFTPGAGYGGHCVTCGLLQSAPAHVTPEQPGAGGRGALDGGHPRPAPPSATAAPATAA